MNRGYTWFDTGTHENISDASIFVKVIEERQGLKIGCIEEIVYKKRYITKEQLRKLALPLSKTNYGKYLLEIIDEKDYQEILEFESTS